MWAPIWVPTFKQTRKGTTMQKVNDTNFERLIESMRAEVEVLPCAEVDELQCHEIDLDFTRHLDLDFISRDENNARARFSLEIIEP